MVSRKVEKKILSEGVKYPVITIVGPRQSGKTTLAKKLFPAYKYVNLEQQDLRNFALRDPKGFLTSYKPPIILDEIQNCPELLSQVQVEVDNSGLDAQFVITGSQQLLLNQAISQSLAGRTSIFTLLPYSISEMSDYEKNISKGEFILNGGMPRLYEKNLEAESYYRDYIQTYIERDVRTLINIKDLRKFELFLTLLAGRVGQILNYSNLAGDVGVSSTTLKEWVSVLEASHIVFTLQPWFGYVTKRLTKSPKLYFVDTGIPCSLLSLTNAERVEKDGLFGNLFENLVVLEALKARYNTGRKSDLYFLRTESGIEIDLIDTRGGTAIPYEIKASDTILPEFFKNFAKAEKFVPNFESKLGGLIYSGDSIESFMERKAFNFKDLEDVF
ncbi:MAG: ATP-binding protein [Fibrobacteraceae bacterium]|nr:ATP-binding protein [Fibrobacteraceae bacterium]